MRCPYCDTPNEETADLCSKCGQQLPQDRGPWRGPQESSQPTSPSDVRSANEAWDPARRYSAARPMSAFVPPARHPDYLSWIISVLVFGIPPTVIHALLFSRHANYDYDLGWVVAILTLCCLPAGFVALLFSFLVRRKHVLGDDDKAYRYSRIAGLLCWISVLLAAALYVVLFLRLFYSIGEFWGY